MYDLKKMITNTIEYHYAKQQCNSNFINIGYGVDDNYVRYMATSIVSFILNNKYRVFNIHVVADDLSTESKEKIRNIAEFYNINITIYEVNIENFRILKRSYIYPLSIYFRFILIDMLDEGTLIYIDSDIICLKDASSLFDVNLEDYTVGAVLDLKRTINKRTKKLNLKSKKYFNSGMLIIDLKTWHEQRLSKKIINQLKVCDKYVFPDQDILNIVLEGNVKFISKIFNCIDISGISIREVVLLHFANNPKPWNRYWKYNPIYSTETKDLYNYYEKYAFYNKSLKKKKISLKIIIKWIMKYFISKIYNFNKQ